MKTHTLQLTDQEVQQLMYILHAHYDEMTYLLQQEVEDGDPNDEVNELTNMVLDVKNLINKVGVLQPMPQEGDLS